MERLAAGFRKLAERVAPLPDEAVVVRGGQMASETLRINAEAHRAEFPGEWAISVSSADVLNEREIAEASPWILNGSVRVSSVGAIRALGHDVVPSGQFPHADLILDSAPSEILWEDLRGVFDDPIPNPRLH